MPTPTPANQLILALDYSETASAWQTVGQLSPPIAFWKVGLELFTQAGPEFVRQLTSRGDRVFLDLKLHDIPNTVAGACRAAASLGVDFLTVHASGGRAMLTQAAQASDGQTKLLAVTLLTSLSELELQDQLKIPLSSTTYVLHLARQAQECGLAGVVCSPWEIEPVRAACGPNFLIVTPGIRQMGSASADQQRICTAQEALNRGADFLVIGRTITQAPDPQQALRQLLETLS